MIVNVVDNTMDVLRTVSSNAAQIYKINILSGKFIMKPIDVSMIDSFHAVLFFRNLIITQQFK